MAFPTLHHPDGLFCPICGCGETIYWPEIFKEWAGWNDDEKQKYEICPCCEYGSEDFPYEDFE